MTSKRTSTCLLIALLLCSSAQSEVTPETSQKAVEALSTHLASAARPLEGISEHDFAQVPLTREDSEKAERLLRDKITEQLRKRATDEIKAGRIQLGELTMKFFSRKFGEKPEPGWSLYISMHGGGGAPAAVNDGQWENQKRLYQLKEGIYLVPRAPTNTWNLWHQGHIDDFFERLITNFVVSEGVNPDRIYLLGYSAGGDGVYQLAPRMADQLAAASMMAGHPNETSPLGLRNLPFTIHVGELDSGYNRNKVAKQWQTKLAELHRQDPMGYPHLVKIHAGKGHWMNLKDAEALPWMAKHTRKRFPERIVWKQDDVAHDRFYWLSVELKNVQPRGLIEATRNGQEIRIQTSDASRLKLLLSDDVIDMAKDVTVYFNDKMAFQGRVPRTINSLFATMTDRGGLADAFCATLHVQELSSLD